MIRSKSLSAVAVLLSLLPGALAAQELFVYGRAGQPCKRCGTRLKSRAIGQRASAYCPSCQH